MTTWTEACRTDDVDNEDVIPVEIDGKTYAIYRSPEDDYYATDGHCTHEAFLLTEGLVMGHIIECPKHTGRFDYCTGAGKGAPIREDLRTYPVKVEAGTVYIDLD